MLDRRAVFDVIKYLMEFIYKLIPSRRHYELYCRAFTFGLELGEDIQYSVHRIVLYGVVSFYRHYAALGKGCVSANRSSLIGKNIIIICHLANFCIMIKG